MGSTEKNKIFLTKFLSLIIIFTLSTTLVGGINDNPDEFNIEPARANRAYVNENGTVEILNPQPTTDNI